MSSLQEQIKLAPEAREEARKWHAKLRSVHEFLSGAVDAVGGKDGVDAIVDAVEQSAPWTAIVLEASAESLPPVKFLLKLFEGMVNAQDPNALGHLACTLAFQRSVQQAVPEVLGSAPPRARAIRKCISAPTAHYDFSTFSLATATTHPFVQDARRALEPFGEALGFDRAWNIKLQREVQARFIPNLKGILSHGKTRDRFAPFRDIIELESEENTLRQALLEHADSQRWLFEERPVLDSERFSLSQVYVEPTCTLLRWEEIRRKEDRQDPFSDKLERHNLLDTVVDTLSNRSYRDILFIQGSAGSGKSTFTLRLCAALVKAGLTPIRVELKHLDARLDVPVEDALVRALEINSSSRFPDLRQFLPQGR